MTSPDSTSAPGRGATGCRTSTRRWNGSLRHFDPPSRGPRDDHLGVLRRHRRRCRKQVGQPTGTPRLHGPVVNGAVPGDDGRLRCPWALSTPDYVKYHDEEWGRRLTTDDAMFERLTLEGFQSGLSWLIVLRKRPAFRTGFAGF